MISVKSVRKVNPQAPLEEAKYYAQVVTSRKVDLDVLADLISDGSTVRRNDVYAVLIGMIDAVTKQLKDGSRIILGELGTFYISVSSGPVDAAEDFNVNQIIKSRIKYLPGAKLKKAMSVIDYSASKKK